MKKEISSLVLGLVIAGILFFSPSVKAAEIVKIRYVPGLYGAPLFVAADKGFFDQAGIKVDMNPTTAVTEVVPFLSTGQIDVAIGGYGAGIFSAVNEGINIRIVAPMAITPKDRVPSGLMVRKNSGIKSVKELKGKKVACAGGLVGGSGFQLIEILEAHGLSGNDVIINNLRFPDQVVALTQGAVDAAMASEPYVTKMKQENIATLLEGSPPGTAVTGVVYGLKFMKERPQVAKNFMVALMKGFREIQGENFFAPEHLEIFHKYTKVAPDVVKQITKFDWDPDMDIGTKTLLKQQATYMKYGSLKYKTPLKPEQFVDETYVKYALSVLGPYKKK
jgi:NitT/TauT family transport system substrate-binding protein